MALFLRFVGDRLLCLIHDAICLLFSPYSLTTIILSRFVLNLRILCYPDETTSYGSSSLVFRARSRVHVTSSNVIGNLGATIRLEPDSNLSPDELEWNVDGVENEEPQFSLGPFGEGMRKASRNMPPRMAAEHPS